VQTIHSFLGRWRSLAAILAVSIAGSVLISACSDDPVLGPSDGESEGGGSYSVIEKLARPNAAEPDSTDASSTPPNPERF
jgi:hypothetical protein